MTGPLALLFSTVIIMGASFSQAFPEYSIKENKKCVYCHFNNQGGPTNARGRYYAKNMTFDGYADHLKAAKKKRKKKASDSDALKAVPVSSPVGAPPVTAPEIH